MTIENTGCSRCMSVGQESDGDYGEIFCGYTCDENPAYANLKSFPFKKQMPCFVEDFWLSPFANEFEGTDDVIEDMDKSKAYQKWKAHWSLPNRKQINTGGKPE